MIDTTCEFCPYYYIKAGNIQNCHVEDHLDNLDTSSFHCCSSYQKNKVIIHLINKIQKTRLCSLISNKVDELTDKQITVTDEDMETIIKEINKNLYK